MAGPVGASSVGPYVPPDTGGSCPPLPLVSGTFAANNSVVSLFQPDPITGQLCAVYPQSVVVGNQIIVGIVLTQPVPGGVVPITVEEFQLQEQAYTVPGPNNTTLTFHHQVPVDVQYSNTSVAETGSRGILQFTLTVPPVIVPLAQPGNLTVGLLGDNFSLGIATPNTYLQVPQSYGQFLSFSAAFGVVALVTFSCGAAFARLILWRVRYVPSLIQPAGFFGVITFGFILWVWADTREAIFLLGETSVFAVYLPLFIFSVLFWLALFEGKAAIVNVSGPVPAIVGGRPGWDTKEYRIFMGHDGWEWCARARWSTFLRFFGIRNVANFHALSKDPAEFKAPGYESIKKDVFAQYFVWDCREGKGSIKRHRARIWLLPWRQRTRAAREEWLRLLGRDPAEAKVGFLASVDAGELAIGAAGERNAAEILRYPMVARHDGRMGELYEAALTAQIDRDLAVQTQIDELARKYATVDRVRERLSMDPEAVRQLEATSAERVLDLFRVKWEKILRQEQDPKSPTEAPRPKAVLSPTRSAAEEALDVRPPWRRTEEHRGGSP